MVQHLLGVTGRMALGVELKRTGDVLDSPIAFTLQCVRQRQCTMGFGKRLIQCQCLAQAVDRRRGVLLRQLGPRQPTPVVQHLGLQNHRLLKP